MAIQGGAAQNYGSVVDYNYQPTTFGASYASRVSRCCRYTLYTVSYCTLGITFMCYFTGFILYVVASRVTVSSSKDANSSCFARKETGSIFLCTDINGPSCITDFVLWPLSLLFIFVWILWIMCHYQCSQDKSV